MGNFHTVFFFAFSMDGQHTYMYLCMCLLCTTVVLLADTMKNWFVTSGWFSHMIMVHVHVYIVYVVVFPLLVHVHYRYILYLYIMPN